MNLTVEAINILFLLIPGFISSVILQCIVQSSDKKTAERLFEIILFNLLIYFIVSLLWEWQAIVVATSKDGVVTYLFNKNYKVLIQMLSVSIILPIPIGAVLYHELHMKLFRLIGITRNSSRQSAWSNAFINQNRYITVTLKNDRQITGHPLYYSHDDSGGYVYLFQPAWVVGEDHQDAGCHGLLVHQEQIETIQFLYNKGEFPPNINEA